MHNQKKKKNSKSPPKCIFFLFTGDMKMTMCTVPIVSTRTQAKERKPGRPSLGGKKAHARVLPGKLRNIARRSLDPCDNSNDSGLG